MNEPLDEKIQRLKAELTVAKQAHQLWDVLIEKRENLEEKISILKSEIDEETSAQYQKAQETYEEIKNRGEKAKALKTIKKNKQTIDDKLDDYEDFSDDIIVYLQNQLVITILKKFPDQTNPYQNLDHQLRQSIDLSDKLKVLKVSTQDIDQLLNRVLEERKRAGPFRILHFFFGRNPYFTITQSIQAIKLLCGNALDVLHDIEETIPNNPRAVNCLEQITEVLVQLQSFAQQRWSYGKIDSQLKPLKGTLAPLTKQLNILKKEADEAIISQKEMINLWIDQHS